MPTYLHSATNILVIIALLLSVTGLIWPNTILCNVAILLIAVALLAQPLLKP